MLSPKQGGEVSSAFPDSEYMKESAVLLEMRFMHLFPPSATPQLSLGPSGEETAEGNATGNQLPSFFRGY